MSLEFLLHQGNKLFEEKAPLLRLWQEIAENFYPERADFTTQRRLGTDLTPGISASTPLLVRRELGNAISTMLRPTNKSWMHPRVQGYDKKSHEAKIWLDEVERVQRTAMYHKPTGFAKATKQADNDFITFGQATMQITLNRNQNGLLYRTWHLRDMAWCEDEEGVIDTVYRKWTDVTLASLNQMFPKTMPQQLKEKMAKSPYDKANIWHIEVPSHIYNARDKRGDRFPMVSLYVEMETKTVLEEVWIPECTYIIPRWYTISGSQYAFSPAVVIATPDARTLQEMMVTLLEAGEKAVTPPMLGVQGALRSDVNVMAGGLTWVDREYDERLGEVLRPLTQDTSGIPLGFEMHDRIKNDLYEAFYLNKIQLPPPVPNMTAYEAGERVQEYIRGALPLFEPMEIEYNGPLCEKSFTLMLRNGVFQQYVGPIPEDLQGEDVKFEFESPLHDAIEKAKSQKYLEAIATVAQAASADPAAIHLIDVQKATREALLASGVPPGWLRSEGDVEDIVAAEQQQQQIAQLLEQMKVGSEIAKNVGTTPMPTGTMGGANAAPNVGGAL